MLFQANRKTVLERGNRMRSVFLGCSVIIYFFLLGFGGTFASDLEELTVNSFIISAKNDYRLRNHQDLLDYTQTASSSTPYVDKIEFRSSSEDFEIAKQRYALRFYPKGWSETRHNRMLTASIMDAFGVEHEVYYNKALLKRYTLVLEYLETAQILKVMHELEAVYEDRLSVLKKQTGSLSFDVGDYIAAETQLTELQLDLVKEKNKLTGIIHKIHLLTDRKSNISFDEKTLAEVEEIVGVLEYLETNENPDNIYLRNRRNRIEREKIKYNIEKAQERDYLSYIQVEYDRDNYQEPVKAYSIDFGFRLPFINSDQEDINRRKVNYIEEKLNYEDEIRSTSERIKSTIRSINRYVDQYRIVSDKGQNSNGSSPLETYMQMEGINPLSLLEIRESVIKKDKQRIQIYFSILYNYVELLDLLGKLSESPLRNH